MDFSRIPRGQLAWMSLVNELCATDDRVERHFLELKSEGDLSLPSDRVKVVKFILGTSNRDPEVAARYFDGHAVLIFGVAHEAINSVPPFEAHEFSRFVAKYIGVPGPRWDFERITTEQGKDVIAIVVDPPTGETWTCLSDGPDKLTDGAIFIRADGETRLAKGAEIRDMVARSHWRQASASLDVAVVGPTIGYLAGHDEILDEYLRVHLERLSKAIPQSKSAAGYGSVRSLPGPGKYLEQRSPVNYRAEVDQWGKNFRAAWPKALDHVAAFLGNKTQIRIINKSDAFLEDVQVDVIIHGGVRSLDAVMERDFNPLSQLPKPPTPWGAGSYSIPDYFLDKAVSRALRRTPTVFHDNRADSTKLTVHLGVLRPQQTKLTRAGEFVLIAKGSEITELRGKWRVTARGHHRLYEGELTVPVHQFDGIGAALRKSFLSQQDG
ncbi:hypothetical protein ACWEGE_29245 [Amycolatopsis sp. NPDC004747]